MNARSLLLTVLALVLLAIPAGAASEAEQARMLKKLFRIAQPQWLQLLEEHRDLLDDSFFQRCQRRIRWDLDNHHLDDAFRFALVADLAARTVHRKEKYRLDLARLAHQAGNDTLATDILDNITVTAREEDEVSRKALFMKASILHDRKQYVDAYQIYDRLVKLNHRTAECLYRMGLISLQMAEEERARQQFEEALRIDPHHDLARQELARLHQGPFATIAPAGNTPGPAAARRAESFFEEAEAFLENNRLDEAEDRYLKAIQANPHHIKAHVYLGALYYRRGALEQAIRHLSRATELDAGDAEAWRFLGNCYERLYDRQGNGEDLDRALEAYRRAAELNPADAFTSAELERAREKIKDRRDRS